MCTRAEMDYSDDEVSRNAAGSHEEAEAEAEADQMASVAGRATASFEATAVDREDAVKVGGSGAEGALLDDSEAEEGGSDSDGGSSSSGGSSSEGGDGGEGGDGPRASTDLTASATSTISSAASTSATTTETAAATGAGGGVASDSGVDSASDGDSDSGAEAVVTAADLAAVDRTIIRQSTRREKDQVDVAEQERQYAQFLEVWTKMMKQFIRAWAIEARSAKNGGVSRLDRHVGALEAFVQSTAKPRDEDLVRVGYLDMLRLWLELLPNGHQPLVRVRLCILNLCRRLPLDNDEVRQRCVGLHLDELWKYYAVEGRAEEKRMARACLNSMVRAFGEEGSRAAEKRGYRRVAVGRRPDAAGRRRG